MADILGLNLDTAKSVDGYLVVQQIKNCAIVVYPGKGNENSVGLVFVYVQDTSGVTYTGLVILWATARSCWPVI